VTCIVLPKLPHYLIRGTIYAESLLNVKGVSRFSLQLLSETFLILRVIQRDMAVNVHRCSFEVRNNSCQILMEVEFAGQIYEKVIKYNI
jgi:hypothetical protein